MGRSLLFCSLGCAHFFFPVGFISSLFLLFLVFFDIQIKGVYGCSGRLLGVSEWHGLVSHMYFCCIVLVQLLLLWQTTLIMGAAVAVMRVVPIVRVLISVQVVWRRIFTWAICTTTCTVAKITLASVLTSVSLTSVPCGSTLLGQCTVTCSIRTIWHLRLQSICWCVVFDDMVPLPAQRVK